MGPFISCPEDGLPMAPVLSGEGIAYGTLAKRETRGPPAAVPLDLTEPVALLPCENFMPISHPGGAHPNVRYCCYADRASASRSPGRAAPSSQTGYGHVPTVGLLLSSLTRSRRPQTL